MDYSKFHKMDLNKYNKILEKSNSHNWSMDIYEKKYIELVSRYSKAYVVGSNWYVGPSFKTYVHNLDLNNLYYPRLEYIRYILRNFD